MTRTIAGRFLIPFAVLVAFPTAGLAADEVVTGYWMRSVANTPSVGVEEFDSLTRVPLVPVPDRGLYVGHDQRGEHAVAALGFTRAAPRGDGAATLTLPVENAVPVDTRVLACAVTAAWEPELNGAWDRRPPIDCARAQAVGELLGDFGQMRWEIPDVSEYLRDGRIEFALVPDVASGPISAVGFGAPFPADLEQHPGAGPTEPSTSRDSPEPAQPQGGQVSAAQPGGPGPPAGGTAPAPLHPPQVAEAPSGQTVEPGVEPLAPEVAPNSPSASPSTPETVEELVPVTLHGSARAVTAVLLMLLAGAALARSGSPVVPGRPIDPTLPTGTQGVE